MEACRAEQDRNDEPKALAIDAICEISSNKTPAHSPIESEWLAGRQEWLIVLCLGVVSLMVALDATIVVPALPVSASLLFKLLLFTML